MEVFFEAKLQELGLSKEVDVDGLARDLVYGSGDDSKTGRECRTCFSALERYDKLRKSIDKSMEEAIEAVIPDVEVPTPKDGRKIQPTRDHCLPALVSPAVVVHLMSWLVVLLLLLLSS